MIDLPTLIALLTALASATTSSPTSSAPHPADGPSAQHCRTAHDTADDGSRQAPDWPRTIILSAPPTQPNGPADKPSGAEPQKPRNSQLRGETDDDDKEAGTPTTTRTPRPKADPEDESDHTAGRSDADHRSTPSSPSPPNGPRPTRGSSPEPTGDDPDEESDSEADTGADGHQRRSTPPTPTNPPDDRSARDTRCDEPPSDRAPDGPARRPTGGAAAPSDLVDLNNWYLTLPTGADGDPDTVQPAELAGYSSSYFELNDDHDGVVFTAPVDGVTTRNSSYPRSELREMKGTEEASWSNGRGTHTLRATEAVTELPPAKPEMVTAQIHGGDDDIMQIRLEGNHLMVQYDDGAKQVTLDPNYRLGTPYDIEIVAAANAVQVRYNGEQKADLPLSGSTWYFKAGAYVQSNPGKGDAGTAAGQVIIYSLEVDHT